MNRMMNDKWPWIEAAHELRAQVLDMLSDTDLAFHPGGQTMIFGALCREMGETEYAYIQSLKNFRQDWSYRNTEAALLNSVPLLKVWFQKLDDELQATIAAFTDQDATKVVDRSGFPATVEFQIDVYLQAVLIFLGKATVYLKAMNKPLPRPLQDYIG